MREPKKPKKIRDWCPYEGKVSTENTGKSYVEMNWLPGWTAPYTPYKRKRVRCPECKRRMIAKVNVCSDGCCISFLIPKHKNML